MNYLVVVDAFFPDRPSGSARVAYDIACLMRDKGVKVSFFCRRQNAKDRDFSLHDGIEVFRFDYPKTRLLDPLKLHKQIAAGTAAAKRYLLGRKWDVVHFHLVPYGLMVMNTLGGDQHYIFTAHSPIVAEAHANWAAEGLSGKIKRLLGTRVLKRLECSVLNRSVRIHTLSNYTRQMLINQYKLAGKFTVIPHWCRPDFVRKLSKHDARKMLGWKDDEKIVFTVRRLAPRMGLDTAIEAIAPLCKDHANLKFYIAGEGPLRDFLIAFTNQVGVSEKVVFLGRVSDDVLKRCYEAADLFVLPTRALECFGLPVLESLAYGLPLVATDAGAIPELMQPILPNCIVPAGNVTLLRQKIEDILCGRIILPSEQSLVEYVTRKFGIDIISKQIIQFIFDGF